MVKGWVTMVSLPVWWGYSRRGVRRRRRRRWFTYRKAKVDGGCRCRELSYRPNMNLARRHHSPRSSVRSGSQEEATDDLFLPSLRWTGRREFVMIL